MNLTLAFILLVVIVCIAFDVFIAAKHGGTATISWQLYTVSKTYPIIPLLVGLVVGHIFGQMS